MIINLVSRFERVGKSEASKLLAQRLGFYHMSFAYNINSAAQLFLPALTDKYQEHGYLGVSLKNINHAISNALSELHPELPVYMVRRVIDHMLSNKKHVVIDDTRRQSEFDWLKNTALNYGIINHIIEIIPIDKQLDKAQKDTWTNGTEPCGSAVWQDMDRSILFNDGTDKFNGAIIQCVNSLMHGGERVIGQL